MRKEKGEGRHNHTRGKKREITRKRKVRTENKEKRQNMTMEEKDNVQKLRMKRKK